MAGIYQRANCVMKRSDGALESAASSTNRTTRAITVSSAGLSTRTRSTASVLIEPARIISPLPLVRGTDSPVRADSSTDDVPETMVPSAATRSPGRTTMMVPRAISVIGVSTRPLGVSTMAVLGAICASALMPERARPAATPSNSSPTAKRQTTMAPSSYAPSAMAPTTAMVISISIVNTEPLRKAAKARRATGNVPIAAATRNSGMAAMGNTYCAR